MSARGSRGGGGRSRAGRGGKGKRTVVWEWESYTPGPEVYEQLWRVRQEPATVTPYLSHDCPIPNAHTRILDRRQTEDEIQRNFYLVCVTHSHLKHPSTLNEEDTLASTEMVEVDLSHILEYISPQALEDFEDEQFKIEAAAEAEVLRQEAEDLARKRLEKNFRAQGTGKGSRMLEGLGLDQYAPTKGKGCGRSRGKGKGKGKGSRQERDTMGRVIRSEWSLPEELEEVKFIHTLNRTVENVQRVVAETESEDDSEKDRRAQTSPSVMRSAFVANSALPVSPLAPHQRLSTMSLAHRTLLEPTDNEDSDVEMDGPNMKSISSADLQQHLEPAFRGRPVNVSDVESVNRDRHRNKRRKTESAASHQRDFSAPAKLLSSSTPTHARTAPSMNRSSILMLGDANSENASDEDIPAEPPAAPYGSSHNNYHDDENIHIPQPDGFNNEIDGDDEEAEEFVVGAIIKHSLKNGKRHYLVKWEDYDDSYDWLPAEDLVGAQERVAEYEESLVKKAQTRAR